MAPGPRQARVVDLGDEGMLREGLSQDGAVACLSLHAQRHSLQATQAQPAVKGTQDGALSILQTPDWFSTPDWLGTLVREHHGKTHMGSGSVPKVCLHVMLSVHRHQKR